MKKLFFSFLLLLILLPNISLARANSQIYDWYIKDFHSDIVVNTDSSLLITEKIVADCGNLPDKHGIFRVLPTQINTPEGKILTPIELVSITDFSGQPLQYSASKQNNTITWKIGDPDIRVKGENTYKIVYKVKNAIRFQTDFEELWWNLNGNFWELEIDNYSADIHFPSGINKDNTQIDYYTGLYGSKDKDLAFVKWQGDVLQVYSTAVLKKDEGISLSVSMPKNIFTPYQPSLADKFAAWKWLIFLLVGFIIFPIITFIVSFIFWKKYGKDPNLHKTVIAEYEAPDNLTPMQMSMLSGLGFLKKEAISATIIKFACDGIIKIEEISIKVFSFESKDYKLTVIDENKAAALTAGEKILFESIFENKKEVILADLKKTFYKKLPDIKKATRDFLEENIYVEKNVYFSKVFLYSFGVYFIFLAFFMFLFPTVLFSLIIVFFFSFLMNKRTMKGAEVEWKIKGFKLFISTAEKYRAQFYEKENMFEKILPYAIAFGLTDKWVKAMQNIYGAEKFAAMAPAWFVGSGANFDVESFSSALTSMTSAISQSASSSTGAGGGGFSGGGGGGGGGGGW